MIFVELEYRMVVDRRLGEIAVQWYRLSVTQEKKWFRDLNCTIICTWLVILYCTVKNIGECISCYVF